jgi:hypothetical protein
MHLWATGACAEVADFGWLVGVLGGLLVDLFAVIAIARTPRLSARAGGQPYPGGVDRVLLPLLPYVLAVAWFAGLWHVGIDQLSCYALRSAAGATILIAVLLIALVPLAAAQIAKRSLW